MDEKELKIFSCVLIVMLFATAWVASGYRIKRDELQKEIQTRRHMGLVYREAGWYQVFLVPHFKDDGATEAYLPEESMDEVQRSYLRLYKVKP